MVKNTVYFHLLIKKFTFKYNLILGRINSRHLLPFSINVIREMGGRVEEYEVSVTYASQSLVQRF